jgi:hypothetical protein
MSTGEAMPWRSRPISRTMVLALGLLISLTACGSSPTDAKSPALLAQPQDWKAVLIAGDNQERAFDNAVDAMADRLIEFGVARSNITVLKATARGREAATRANVRTAIAGLHAGPADGCFVFITSHGAPKRGLVLALDDDFLGPEDLARSLQSSCADRPTVVIASGCYSGIFAEGRGMPSASRTILTAARDDRPSFGCNANLRFTVFDQCVLSSLDRGIGWRDVMTATRLCVRKNERAMGTGQSEPQLWVGAATANLQVFPP